MPPNNSSSKSVGGGCIVEVSTGNYGQYDICIVHAMESKWGMASLSQDDAAIANSQWMSVTHMLHVTCYSIHNTK